MVALRWLERTIQRKVLSVPYCAQKPISITNKSPWLARYRAHYGTRARQANRTEGGTTNIHQLRKGVVKYTDPSSSPSSLHQDARWTRLCLGPERKLLRLESSSASGHPTDGFRWPLPRWFDSTLEYGLGTARFTVCVSRVWRPARDGPARCGDDCIAV